MATLEVICKLPKRPERLQNHTTFTYIQHLLPARLLKSVFVTSSSFWLGCSLLQLLLRGGGIRLGRTKQYVLKLSEICLFEDSVCHFKSMTPSSSVVILLVASDDELELFFLFLPMAPRCTRDRSA